MPTALNLAHCLSRHVCSQGNILTPWTIVDKDKEVGRLNVLVDLQIFAWSTSPLESRAKSLVDLATICSSTEMFSCPSFLASFMIVQEVELFSWEHVRRGTRDEIRSSWCSYVPWSSLHIGIGCSSLMPNFLSHPMTVCRST